mgnify:CR=1 FL=1|tara:strand:+ start:510 stop:920 length:411 start_codon:yes stop_codon:yes gene_type:complete
MRDLYKEIMNYPQDKINTYYSIMRCHTPDDFKKLAVKLGANMRDKNHIWITHKNGDVTPISCTPGKKIPLHKTQNDFVDIYILNKSNHKNELRREQRNNRDISNVTENKNNKHKKTNEMNKNKNNKNINKFKIKLA